MKRLNIQASGKEIRDDFCAALDAQRVTVADAIFVLRNWNSAVTNGRLATALSLLEAHFAPLMCMSYDKHTLGEAHRLSDTALRSGWRAVTIVTHRSHHYRAYLTFRKVLHPGIKLYSWPVADGPNDEEFLKIEEYSRKGDIYTYEEGLNALNTDTA